MTAPDQDDGRLSQLTIDRMLAVFLRNPEAFQEIHEILTFERLDSYQPSRALPWKKADEFYLEHGELPSHDLLHSMVQDAIHSDPEYLSDTEIDEMGEFLDWVFDSETFDRDPTLPKYRRFAVSNAQMFLRQHVTRQAAKTLQAADMQPTSLPDLLEPYYRQAESIENLDTPAYGEAFPQHWEKKVKKTLIPTGLEPLDDFLGGGMAGKEVYCTYGPYGSCKTTLAVQLAVNMANRFNEIYQADGSEPPYVSYYFSYEADIDELRERAVGYDAEIPRSRLEKMEDRESMSNADDLADYEKEKFKQQLIDGDPVQGEQERIQASEEVLNRHLALIDLTGADPNRRWSGGGWVKEVARIVQNDLRRRGAKCGFVVIDYMGAMVDAYIETNDLKDDERRQLLKRTPLQSKNKLAKEFDCPVMLIHQLSAQANAKKPGAAMHHTDSAESKGTAENLDFAFVLGTPTLEQRLQIICTKHRRNTKMDSRVLWINGGWYRVEEDDQCQVDHARNTIVKKQDAESIGGPDASDDEGGTPSGGSTPSDPDEEESFANESDYSPGETEIGIPGPAG